MCNYVQLKSKVNLPLTFQLIQHRSFGEDGENKQTKNGQPFHFMEGFTNMQICYRNKEKWNGKNNSIQIYNDIHF